VIAALPVLLLVLLGAARVAHADDRYGVVTLDLRAELGDAPTHLCVVSEAKGPRTRQNLGELLEQEPEGGGPGVGTRRTWFVKPEVWSGDQDSAEQLRCSEDPLGDCRPRVELPPGLSQSSDLYVACTPDSLTQGNLEQGPRPLFILLEHLEGSPPSVESVRLAGGVATIGVQANLEQVLVTARSLGGHYLPDKVSVRGVGDTRGDAGDVGPPRRNIELQLRPRCEFVEVRLPRTRLRPGDRDRLTVRVHGMDFDVDRCVGPLTGAEVLQVRVPQAPLGVGAIDVDLAATEEGKAAARYGASWEGRWPKTPFALQFNQVSFTWVPPKCIYPTNTCPTAQLDSGTSCEATRVTTRGGGSQCTYRCPGSVTDDAIDLSFPIGVTFRKESPVQEWSEKLLQNGQVLRSYVPPDDIYLNTNVNGWRTNEPANQIKEIEIFGEDGGVHRYSVSHVPNLQMKVPGATCEPIPFHIRGDRAHEDAVATVEDGQIDFGNPRRTARRFGVNLTAAIGGGPAWSDTAVPGAIGGTSAPPVYFSGLGMLALQYRPRPAGWSRFGWELRLGGTLGRWGIIETDVETEEATGEQRLGWARVLAEPGVVFAAHQRVGIGAGMGLGFSFPFRRNNTQITGDTLNFIWSPSLDGRFYIRKWIALMLQFRGVFGEKAFELATPGGDTQALPPCSPDLDPMVDMCTPTAAATETAKARSLIVLFGVNFQF
jgi:hypothetical protein